MRDKDGDFSCETAMPGRKNVDGSVDVTVVCRGALAAGPECSLREQIAQAKVHGAFAKNASACFISCRVVSASAVKLRSFL